MLLPAAVLMNFDFAEQCYLTIAKGLDSYRAFPHSGLANDSERVSAIRGNERHNLTYAMMISLSLTFSIFTGLESWERISSNFWMKR
jgi:hypothetical protein